jgi:predicted RecA/RadA family phage recombinase
MYAKYVQKGDSVDYTPSENILAGDVKIIADLVGVAKLDIAAGELGALAVVGVFDVVKAEVEIAAGTVVFWDAGAKKATTVQGSNHYLGKAVASATEDDENVRVLLNAPYSLATDFVAGDPITDLTRKHC